MTTIQSSMPAQAAGHTFYLGMALTFVAVAFLGFAPTYFAPLARGTFADPPVVHVHGLLFFAWPLFLCFQAWQVANGRSAAHREWGMLGVALATAMVFSVLVTVVVRLNQAEALGVGPGVRAFSWVQVSGMLFFGAAFAAAVANVRRPEVHKRLVLLATISLMDAPIARWFITLMAPSGSTAPAGPPPVAVTIPPALVADLLLVAALAYDWRTRGRPHPVYVVGGVLLLLFQLTRPLVSATPQWDAAAALLTRLGAA